VLASSIEKANALPDVKHPPSRKTTIKKKQKTSPSSPSISLAVNESSNSSTGTRSSPSPEVLPVSVQAILIPRNLHLPFWIRATCLVSLIISLVKCLETAGVPHIRAIWALLNQLDSSSATASFMPHNYRPSSLDLFVARAIASSSMELLPPLWMPNARPLLGLFASLVVYIGTTMLLPRWFTSVQVGLNYQQLAPTSISTNFLKNNPSASVLVHLEDDFARRDLSETVGTNHKTLICPLHLSSPNEASGNKSAGTKKRKQVSKQSIEKNAQYSHPCPLYFELNQCRVYFDETTGNCVDGGPTLHSARLEDLQQLVAQHGLSTTQRYIAQDRYGPYNRPQLASPSVQEAFSARISSPLVVVQLVGRILSALEDGPSAIINLLSTVVHHYWNSRQAIISARLLAREVQASVQESSRIQVWVLREGKKKKKWVSTTAVEIFPGDVFVMTNTANQEDLVIPVDALVLNGQCLTNEAVLTGESVPQCKVPMDFVEATLQKDAALDMRDHRNFILFAGTNMVHCSSEQGSSNDAFPPLPSSVGGAAVTCLALRTGTYSSKGELLRALKSSSHVGAISNPQSEKDGMRLIASLSVCALASCASLFVPRGHEKQRPVSAFRRVIQCTRIAVASIPSDLPLALSAVARTCSQKLRQDADVVCSEAGSLLTAAHIDMVVFDKVRTDRTHCTVRDVVSYPYHTVSFLLSYNPYNPQSV
jgi:hypothetical protein